MMAERRRDFTDRWMAGQDALRKFQQAVGRMALPAEQRRLMTEGLSRMIMPGKQLEAMVEMMEAFGPPVAQIEAVHEKIAEQRVQLQEMNDELDRIESAVSRLAIAAEQLAAFQQPFVRMAAAVTGMEVPTSSGRGSDSERRRGRRRRWRGLERAPRFVGRFVGSRPGHRRGVELTWAGPPAPASSTPSPGGYSGRPPRCVWPVDIKGLEHLPPEGGVIIAPNHISFLDSVVLIGVLPRRITYIGKAEYLDNWKTRFLFPAVGMIPIDRTGGKSSAAALDTAARVLESGQLFGIFPEGTRSRDGLLLPGPHRHRPPGPAHRGTRGAGRHRRHGPHPAARRSRAPPLQALHGPLRRADRGGPLRGAGGRRPGLPGADRRDHVRDRRPVRPAVRRPLRRPQGGG